MTQNQIRFYEAKNNARHQRVSERQTDDVNKETQRSNKIREAETMRSNLAKEAENYRSNKAREDENFRANFASEQIRRQANAITLGNAQAALSEQAAHNRTTENIAGMQNYLKQQELSSQNALRKQQIAESQQRNVLTQYQVGSEQARTALTRAQEKLARQQEKTEANRTLLVGNQSNKEYWDAFVANSTAGTKTAKSIVDVLNPLAGFFS